MNPNQLGASGEEAAAEHLRRIGWRILARNVRAGRGELDIVAQEGDELVVVEVRTRTVGLMQSGEESVGPRKRKNLLKAARIYVDSIAYDGFWRIDVISVTNDVRGGQRIKLFRGAVTGEGG